VASVAQSFKEQLVGWGVPDYTAGIALSANTDFIAPCVGIVISNGSIYVNGAEISHFVSVVSGYNSSNGTPIVVDKGDVCKQTSSSNNPKFYPFKGVN
jgi:hypothetical protein